MPASFATDNPLLSHSPVVWQQLIDGAGPASLLVAIESRMSSELRARTSPEDIFQDALLHAWRDRAAFEWRGQRSFRSWLLSIIDNRIRDAADFEGAMKRGGHHLLHSIDGEARPMHEGRPAMPPALIASTTPSRVAIVREQAAAIAQAIAALPEELRDVVQLRLIEHRTIEQIAEALSIGVAAVRHRFRKGAEAYRQRLQHSMISRSHGMAHRILEDSAPLGAADSSA